MLSVLAKKKLSQQTAETFKKKKTPTPWAFLPSSIETCISKKVVENTFIEPKAWGILRAKSGDFWNRGKYNLRLQQNDICDMLFVMRET